MRTCWPQRLRPAAAFRYPSPVGLKSQTFPQPGNDRPLVRLEVSDHPLSQDFHNGMAEERARAIFELILHRQNPPH
uniref:Uncharacterized protein n=1 Tax=Ralstonia solanacearum TaxID=305 RepID=A0A0S4W940_RALSL|nr:protein of unknown function [Ralstonia solanacearum]